MDPRKDQSSLVRVEDSDGPHTMRRSRLSSLQPVKHPVLYAQDRFELLASWWVPEPTSIVQNRNVKSEIAALLHDFGDDGHAIKQARPTAVLYELMQQYKEQDWAVLKDEDVWRQVQSMVADAVQGPGRMYVRTAGLKEAWEVSSLRRVCDGSFPI